MKKKLLLLSVLTLLLSTSIWAYDFSAENSDGVTIYYNITSSEDKTVGVTYGGEDHYARRYSGDVVIPETVTYNGITYTVTTIGNDAFYSCWNLTSVTIPESVKTMGNNSFLNCTVLTQVSFNATACESAGSSSYPAFKGCTNLATVNFGDNVTIIPDYLCSGLSGLTGELIIPESVVTIGQEAFYNCSGLTGTLTIPESVTLIGSAAFRDCSGLTSIIIGESVTEIGSYAFYKCSGLTSIIIGEGVTSIGSYAFYNCSGLTGTLTIPNVTEIGSSAFCGCSGLTGTLTIPNGVTSIGSYAFYNCSGLTGTPTIPDGITTINDYTFYNCSGLTSVSIPESITEIGNGAFQNCTGLTEVNFNATSCTSAGSSKNPVFGGCKNLKTAYIGDNVISIPSYLFYNCTGLADVNIPESVTSIEDDAFGKCSGLWSISNKGKTQLTSEMKITSNISGAESGIVYDDEFYSVDDDGYYTFTDLIPGDSYSFYFGVKLSNGSYSYHGDAKTVTTTSINPKITQISLTPETLTATGSYTTGDAEVTETGFTGYTTDGVTLSLTNLEPKTQYTVEYYVRASGNKFTASTTFTTPAVEFTTLPAKATSNTVARIGATTNLSDDAVGAGFEWRRNDAPSTMPSSQAECPVIDGELSGTLNGLSSDTYYDFRPYYTSQGGKTYYGDWVTLLTADAYVYFEPTVRTYEATSVSSESATVKAYAVAGSDDITSQGFEYWEGGSSSAMNVRRTSTTDENGVTRVEVSGQWMTATFEDLEPSTTYSYRAYVTTAVGTTYGETMSFTTDVPTGIESMTAEETEVYEIARYTLDGKKVSQPLRGINIIRYSDGTARKVLVK